MELLFEFNTKLGAISPTFKEEASCAKAEPTKKHNAIIKENLFLITLNIFFMFVYFKITLIEKKLLFQVLLLVNFLQLLSPLHLLKH